MPESDFHRNNHYVSRSYLRRWTNGDGRIAVYRLLVSHATVPEWRYSSTGAVGYHEHLYTRVASDTESDDIERWLDRDFEAPAEDPLRRATSGRQMTREDWRHLIRFLAAQDARTPARLLQSIRRNNETMQDIVEKALRSSLAKLEEYRRTGESVPEVPPEPDSDLIPFRVNVERDPTGEGGILRAEVLNGRGLWLFSLRHTLSRTLRALLVHRWTILKPPAGRRFFTSDDPVLRLNYNSLSDYSLDGGWGSPGTEIMFPLSPHYLMYTQVGRKVPTRESVMPEKQFALVRRFLAEGAHRYIYATGPDPEVPRLRRRLVDERQFELERLEWRNWAREQLEAERRFRSGGTA